MDNNGRRDTHDALQRVLESINDFQRSDLHQGRRIAGQIALNQMLDDAEDLVERRQSGTPVEAAVLITIDSLEPDADRWRALRASGALPEDLGLALLTLQIRKHVLARMIKEEIYYEPYRMELTVKLLRMFGEEEAARLCEDDPEEYCRTADRILEEARRRWGTEMEPGEGTTGAGGQDK